MQASSFFITFEVMGHPEPAGSKRIGRVGGPNGKPIILDANKKAAPWKNVVAATARGQMLKHRLTTFAGPVWVSLTFRRERPKSHFNKDGTLNTAGRQAEYPIGKPDVLKLARAVEDAMSDVVYTDDAHIVSETLRKEWGPEGVTVQVMPL